MTMIKKFRMVVCYADGTPHPFYGDTWNEEYEKETDDPKKWAQDTIAQFNATLRPYEKARRLVDVVLLDEHNDPIDHKWEKTNLVSNHDGTDDYRCSRCGVRGKKGILGDVRRLSKYRAKVYENCTTAKRHLDKKHAKARDKS